MNAEAVKKNNWAILNSYICRNTGNEYCAENGQTTGQRTITFVFFLARRMITIPKWLG